MLYQFAGRFVKDKDISENIVQEIFVKLWENRDKLNIQSNVKSYLYTAVKNHSLNYIKKEKQHISIEDETESSNYYSKAPDEEMIDKELYDSVQAAINKLPEHCRQIYLLKRYDELSYSEIAEVQNVSINTVKTQLKRAVKSLSKNLAHLRIILLGF